MFYTTLEIKSDVSEISAIESFIDNLMQDFFIDEDYRGIVTVPLIESVINAITHGNKKDVNKKVLITCQFSEKQLEFSVSDQGQGFDFQTVFYSKTAEEKSNGFAAIKLLCDEVSFLNNGSTIVYTVTVPRKVENNKNLKIEEAEKITSKSYI